MIPAYSVWLRDTNDSLVVCNVRRESYDPVWSYAGLDIETITVSETVSQEEADNMTPERLVEICRELEARAIGHLAGWDTI